MTDMRALINSLNKTEAIVEAELAAVAGSPAAAFGSWGRNAMQVEQSVVFHAGALLGRQLRHVLERHPEFTFEESKGEHDTKFTVKGDADFLEALKRIVSKLTASANVVDEAETIETHASREPTEEENEEALSTISMLVKTGHTSGHASLESGARYSWTLSGDNVVEDDEFAQEYVAGLIADGYREGHNPQWALAVNIWGDRIEAELDEGSEELTYPDGEVYHTEYDAPGENSKVVDKHGREGTLVSHEPSRHGHEFAPDIEVEWDDEPGVTYRMTTDDVTEVPHQPLEQADDAGALAAEPAQAVDSTCYASISGSHRYIDGVCTRCNEPEAALDEEAPMDFDDGIADTEVLGLDDMGGEDVGSDFCFGTPTGEHHFINGECIECGQDESFEVDEQDVEIDTGETPGFNDEERIPR